MPDQPEPATASPTVTPAPAPAPAARPDLPATVPGRFVIDTPFAGLAQHAILTDPPAALHAIYGRHLTPLADGHWSKEHHKMVDAMDPLASAKEG